MKKQVLGGLLLLSACLKGSPISVNSLPGLTVSVKGIVIPNKNQSVERLYTDSSYQIIGSIDQTNTKGVMKDVSIVKFSNDPLNPLNNINRIKLPLNTKNNLTNLSPTIDDITLGWSSNSTTYCSTYTNPPDELNDSKFYNPRIFGSDNKTLLLSDKDRYKASDFAVNYRILVADSSGNCYQLKSINAGMTNQTDKKFNIDTDLSLNFYSNKINSESLNAAFNSTTKATNGTMQSFLISDYRVKDAITSYPSAPIILKNESLALILKSLVNARSRSDNSIYDSNYPLKITDANGSGVKVYLIQTISTDNKIQRNIVLVPKAAATAATTAVPLTTSSQAATATSNQQIPPAGGWPIAGSGATTAVPAAVTRAAGAAGASGAAAVTRATAAAATGPAAAVSGPITPIMAPAPATAGVAAATQATSPATPSQPGSTTTLAGMTTAAAPTIQTQQTITETMTINTRAYNVTYLNADLKQKIRKPIIDAISFRQSNIGPDWNGIITVLMKGGNIAKINFSDCSITTEITTSNNRTIAPGNYVFFIDDRNQTYRIKNDTNYEININFGNIPKIMNDIKKVNEVNKVTIDNIRYSVSKASMYNFLSFI